MGRDGFEPPVFSQRHLVYSQAPSPFGHRPNYARERIRTFNTMGLNHMSLPFGLLAHLPDLGFEPRTSRA